MLVIKGVNFVLVMIVHRQPFFKTGSPGRNIIGSSGL